MYDLDEVQDSELLTGVSQQSCLAALPTY